MPQTLRVRCEDDLAAEVARLAKENNASKEEVLQQLIRAGLETIQT